MADFELSSYQKDIISYFKKHLHDNMFIQARAGASKTFILTELSKDTTTSDIYIAFNNSIAEEVKSKITNPKVKIYTIHSLALSIMNTNLKNHPTKGQIKPAGIGVRNTTANTDKAVLDNFKIQKIVDEILNDKFGRYADYDLRMFLKDNYIQLYNLCRLTCTNINDANSVYRLSDSYQLFVHDGDNDSIEPPSKHEMCVMLKDIDTTSAIQFDQSHTIDFTDMIYITYQKLKNREWEVPYWNLYTNVMVDECIPGTSYVSTQDGKSISLKTLFKKVNQNKETFFIKSFNTQTEKFEYKKVLNVKKKGLQKVFTVKTEGLNKFTATANHPFLTQRGFVPLSDLRIGEDYLYLDKPNFKDFSGNSVKEIIPQEEKEVYDIEIEDNHNFVVWEHNPSNKCTGVVVHNCQDLSKLQQHFIAFIRRNNGRYVFSGDTNQAIYRFAAADTQSMDSLYNMFSPAKQFSLPICYRCPVSHLDFVHSQFPDIDIYPRPDAPEGEIHEIEKCEIVYCVQPGDMIISRKNKWLAPVVWDLATNGIKICIQDKDFVANVFKSIKRLNKKSAKDLLKKLNQSVETFKKNIMVLEQLSDKYDSMSDEERFNAQKEAVEGIADSNTQIDTNNFIITVLGHYLEEHPSATTEKFEDYMKKILNTTPSSDAVRICSIHKAKGLEANNVFCLNRGQWQFRFGMSQEQLQQEKNLSYIAWTRAKDKLYLVEEESEDKSED